MDLSVALDSLRTTGEKLPPALRKAIVAHGEAAVAPLLAIFQDESLAEATGPDDGWAPIHAVDLLADLKDPTSIEPMLDMLEATDWNLIVHDRIMLRLHHFGAPALEPLLARIDKTEDEQERSMLCTIVAELGTRDERAFRAICESFEHDVVLGCNSLADYGDIRGLPMIVEALQDFEIQWDSGGPISGLIDLVDAYERLAGAPLPGDLRDHVDAIRERFASARRPARSNKVGRNEPCPCGSGKKFKKCCIDKPASTTA